MKIFLPISLLVLFLFSSCSEQATDENLPGPDQQIAIKNKLETIATEFLKSWEPPFDSEKAVTLFTESDDFHLIIDGRETSEYADWAYLAPKWMAHDAAAYTSYAHEIQNIETVVLSPNSGVVTVVYIWDSISTEGRHARIYGAITLACRNEDGVWKIVHYHGSHYDPGEE